MIANTAVACSQRDAFIYHLRVCFLFFFLQAVPFFILFFCEQSAVAFARAFAPETEKPENCTGVQSVLLWLVDCTEAFDQIRICSAVVPSIAERGGLEPPSPRRPSSASRPPSRAPGLVTAPRCAVLHTPSIRKRCSGEAVLKVFFVPTFPKAPSPKMTKGHWPSSFATPSFPSHVWTPLNQPPQISWILFLGPFQGGL